jgi:dihydrofolate synthase/folylpolyglutamate synthase
MTDLQTPLIGVHQAENAARAITALLDLARRDARFSGVSEESIRRGLAADDWPGRMEVIRRAHGPSLILDGAHNGHGAGALVSSLRGLVSAGDEHRVGGIISAVMRDKDIPVILSHLGALGAPMYCTSLPMERALPAAGLADMAASAGVAVGGAFTDPSDALESASRALRSSDLLVCCGSLYLVGYLKKILAYPELS